MTGDFGVVLGSVLCAAVAAPSPLSASAHALPSILPACRLRSEPTKCNRYSVRLRNARSDYGQL